MLSTTTEADLVSHVVCAHKWRVEVEMFTTDEEHCIITTATFRTRRHIRRYTVSARSCFFRTLACFTQEGAAGFYIHLPSKLFPHP